MQIIEAEDQAVVFVNVGSILYLANDQGRLVRQRPSGPQQECFVIVVLVEESLYEQTLVARPRLSISHVPILNLTSTDSCQINTVECGCTPAIKNDVEVFGGSEISPEVESISLEVSVSSTTYVGHASLDISQCTRIGEIKVAREIQTCRICQVEA